jgi:hypothetical protein
MFTIGKVNRKMLKSPEPHARHISQFEQQNKQSGGLEFFHEIRKLNATEIQPKLSLIVLE